MTTGHQAGASQEIQAFRRQPPETAWVTGEDFGGAGVVAGFPFGDESRGGGVADGEIEAQAM